MKRFSHPNLALRYLAECALATVEGTLMRYRYSKTELRREQEIARISVQAFIDAGGLPEFTDRFDPAPRLGEIVNKNHYPDWWVQS